MDFGLDKKHEMARTLFKESLNMVLLIRRKRSKTTCTGSGRDRSFPKSNS